jgi:uncharacterized ferritin-like protein (DUF455 family)
MDIVAYAERVLLAESLEEKLSAPSVPLTEGPPGLAVRHARPGRPANLQFAPRRRAPGMPAFEALRDPRRRAVAHHIMANHELQAAEVMAWVLLAFPDAPAAFRSGLAGILADEQRHTRMHATRARQLGLPFGSLPVNDYIWKQTDTWHSLLDYLATLPLLFEGRNLDHTLELAGAFTEAGDPHSAALMQIVHEDEIRHVAFGIEWLRRLKPEDQSDWEAFQSHLHWPLRPSKARGRVFQREPRRRAGLSEEFLNRLAAQADELQEVPAETPDRTPPRWPAPHSGTSDPGTSGTGGDRPS